MVRALMQLGGAIDGLEETSARAAGLPGQAAADTRLLLSGLCGMLQSLLQWCDLAMQSKRRGMGTGKGTGTGNGRIWRRRDVGQTEGNIEIIGKEEEDRGTQDAKEHDSDLTLHTGRLLGVEPSPPEGELKRLGVVASMTTEPTCRLLAAACKTGGINTVGATMTDLGVALGRLQGRARARGRGRGRGRGSG